MITVRVPGMLKRYLGVNGVVEVEATTVGEAFAELNRRFPLVERHLFDGDELRPHIFAVANGHRVGARDSDLPLMSGDELVILQAVSGG